MNSHRKFPLLLLIMSTLFFASLVNLDRTFFKASKSFCLRFLYTCLPNNPKWDIPAPSTEEIQLLDQILNQKFHYLAKGAHCYAFMSEDKQYVIKFHKYASHMRIFPWLTHPFSYLFNEKRKKIKAYNLNKLDYNFSNYKASYEDLKKESGLILIHINRTDNLNRTITLVDKTHAEYTVPLDRVTFILQHKANLLYPTLDRLYAAHEITQAKQVVSQVIQLISSCCEKGYVDKDPVLRKNYGLLAGEAIHIDIGDMVKDDSVKDNETRIAHVKELTECLRKRLESTYPQLLEHYNHEIARL